MLTYRWLLGNAKNKAKKTLTLVNALGIMNTNKKILKESINQG